MDTINARSNICICEQTLSSLWTMVKKGKFLFFVTLIFGSILLLFCFMFIYLHKDDLYQPFRITSPIKYPRLNISIRNTHSKIPTSTTDIPKKNTIGKKISEIKYSKTTNALVNTTTAVPASTNSIQRIIQDLSTGNLKPKSNWYTTSQLISRTSNCTTYFETFPVFALHSKFVKGEEKKILERFSLAFAHMVHKDISILEVFLSIYFRSDNFHCVHVDAKASQDIRNAVAQQK